MSGTGQDGFIRLLNEVIAMSGGKKVGSEMVPGRQLTVEIKMREKDGPTYKEYPILAFSLNTDDGDNVLMEQASEIDRVDDPNTGEVTALYHTGRRVTKIMILENGVHN